MNTSRTMLPVPSDASSDAAPVSPFVAVTSGLGADHAARQAFALSHGAPHPQKRRRHAGRLGGGVSARRVGDIDMAIGDAFLFAGPRCDRIVASVPAKMAHAREASRP